MRSLDRIVYKHYPCNIYLNLVAKGVAELGASSIDRLTVRLPPVAHLDRIPADVREARNSAQGVAAIALLHPLVYRSFTEKVLRIDRNEELRRLFEAVEVVFDPSIPTDLRKTAVVLDAFHGGKHVGHGEHDMSELGVVSKDHLSGLERGMATQYGERIYSEDYVAAHHAVEVAVTRGPVDNEEEDT